MAVQSLRKLLQLNGSSLSDGSLLLSLHPDGSRVAIARGPALVVCPLLPDRFPEAAAAGRHGTASGGIQGTDEALQQQQALQERRATHGSAGPRSGARPGSPLRFACATANGPAVASQDDITALAWLAFARPPSAVQGGSGSPDRGRDIPGGANEGQRLQWQGRAGSDRRRTVSSGGSSGVFASIQIMMEDHELQQQQHQQAATATAAVPRPFQRPDYSLVVLLSGTRGGALQLHDAGSGEVMLRQQLHPGPVVSIAIRTWRMGLNPCEAVEDVTVGWADAVARLAAWELRAAATTCYAAAAAAAEAKARGGGGTSGGQSLFGLWGSSSSSSSAPSGPDIKPLAVQKWEVPAGAARGRSCVVCCGQRPRDLYSLLQGIGSASSAATGKTIFLAGGNRPACLAALEVDEQSSGGGGALSYISCVATSVWGLARTARNVAAAPLSLRDGLKYFVMNPLQLAAASGAASASGAAAPLASFPDPTAGQRLPSTGLWRQLRDDGRAVLALAPAPHGSLVAATDSLGRLLLVEVGAMLITRMWKGYRDAQVAWMEVRVGGVARLLERQRDELSSQQHEQPQQAQQQSCGRSGVGQGQVSMPAVVAHGSSGGAASRACAAGMGGGADRRGQWGRGGTPPCESGRGGGGGRDEEEEEEEQYVLLLAVYAPRRQTLELWFPLQGERLAAVAAPPKARLLQRGGGGSSGGGELGTWRVADAASAASPPMTPTGCMICFVGAVPRLGFGVDELESVAAGADGASGDGLQLLDVGDVFGLA
ncbi:hypothetical protein PLESTF_000205600 [Pleodorina starrii]|nr:hypothetical protein PLESTF_000205600 [Pleodorina starrii]